jgi:hypothetical protein
MIKKKSSRLKVAGALATVMAFGSASFAGAAGPRDLTASPSRLSFGTVPVGGIAQMDVTLTNNGTTATQITAETTSGAYGLAQNCLNDFIGPDQSCIETVFFSPGEIGRLTGTLSITDTNAPTTLDIALSGRGASAVDLTASPSRLNFGTVPVGGIAQMDVTLTNNGTTATQITAETTSGAYGLAQNCLNDFIGPDQSCIETVFFSPGETGHLTGTLMITHTDVPAAVTLNVPLSGRGVTP